MKQINIILLIIIIFLTCLLFLILYDLKHPKVIYKSKKYNITFKCDDKIKEAQTMFVLPKNGITISRDIKSQLESFKSDNKLDKIGDNEFSLRLPAKINNYTFFPTKEDDENLVVICLFFEPDSAYYSAGCSLNIVHGKYDYVINEFEYPNERDSSNREATSPDNK